MSCLMLSSHSYLGFPWDLLVRGFQLNILEKFVISNFTFIAFNGSRVDTFGQKDIMKLISVLTCICLMAGVRLVKRDVRP